MQVDSRFTTTGRNETTCQAALGYSFAAGTTDGPGDFDFTQSSNSTNVFWQFVSSFLSKATPEQIKCQAPKPILLDVGLIKPVEWVPFVLPQQIFQIGQLYIVAVLGEFTTMSGRRLKIIIQKALQNAVNLHFLFHQGKYSKKSDIQRLFSSNFIFLIPIEIFEKREFFSRGSDVFLVQRVPGHRIVILSLLVSPIVILII